MAWWTDLIKIAVPAVVDMFSGKDQPAQSDQTKDDQGNLVAKPIPGELEKREKVKPWTSMRDNIIKFNASQQNAMSESNAARTTQVSLASAAAGTQVSLAGAAAATQVSLAGAATATQVSLANAAQINIERKFQDQRADEAERFNATNTLNIAKSNAEWRRSTNTANTAAENNANMVNAQNLYNISQQAQANLWQQSRDVFSWANQAATNEKDRAFKITMYALGRQDYLDDMAEAQRNEIRGGIAELLVNIVGPMATAWAENPGND